MIKKVVILSRSFSVQVGLITKGVVIFSGLSAISKTIKCNYPLCGVLSLSLYVATTWPRVVKNPGKNCSGSFFTKRSEEREREAPSKKRYAFSQVSQVKSSQLPSNSPHNQVSYCSSRKERCNVTTKTTRTTTTTTILSFMPSATPQTDADAEE